MYEILNDQPVQTQKLGKHGMLYPIKDLLVGQSFQFPVEGGIRVRNAAAQHKARNKHNGWDYVCRRIDGVTMQLWRIK